MKITIGVAIIAVCFAASHAAPHLATKTIDWTAVVSKVSEIESLICTAVRDIKATAVLDNVQIGRAISIQLDAAAVRAYAVLEVINQKITDRSLNEGTAREHLQELKDILVGIQEQLKEEINLLSRPAGDKVRSYFADAHVGAEQKAQELYSLLRQ